VGRETRRSAKQKKLATGADGNS